MRTSDENKGIHFRLLGELRVTVDGNRLKLPPSKKTRALLAYLLLTGRSHRRERLCALFWDVTDDPRAALRWSLSRLRAQLSEGAAIEADRERVELVLSDAHVDVLELRAALSAQGGIKAVDTARLQTLAEAFSGELMEGLDLPDFDDFQAFCVAEREQTRIQRAAVLEELCQRLREDPSAALPHARGWVQADPLDLNARRNLLRVALAGGRPEEAAQHFESARRMFAELGSEHLHELAKAWQALQASGGQFSVVPVPPVAPVPQVATEPKRSLLKPESSGHEEVQREPLVGRAGDLLRLTDLLGKVRVEGKERIALLTGEPGIGKTRLLDELVRVGVSEGAVIMRGAAFEGERGRPYGPFTDGLRALSGSEDADLQAALSPLLSELGGTTDRGAMQERLFASVAGLLARQVQRAAVAVLVVDDIQWLDPASAELLHYLARTGRDLPLLIVLSARSEELPDNEGVARVLRSLRRDRLLSELPLEPLDIAALSALIAHYVGRVEPAALARQSGGNPLFALELLRMAADEQGAPGDDVSGNVPETVGDVVRERVERHSTEARDVLRWAAVLGERFELDQISHVSTLSLDALVTALEALEQGALLASVDGHAGQQTYRFAHDLVRRAIYVDLSEPRRRLMHRKVAAVMKTQADAGEESISELARHATLGHDHDLAAEACAAAGLRCQRLFAYDQALHLARRGLRHAEHLSGVSAVCRRIELREVQFLASRPEDMGAIARELRQLSDDAVALGATAHARRAISMLSYISWEGGAWADAKRESLQLEALSRSAPGGDDADGTEVQSIAYAARCLILLERDMPQASALLMEAEKRARPLGLEPGAMLDARGMIHLRSNEHTQAMSMFERASTVASLGGDRALEFHAHEHQCMSLLERAEYARAQQHTPQLVALGERMREGSEGPFARALHALAGYGLGEDVALDLESALEDLRRVDAKYRLAYALTHAGLVDLAHDQPESALARGEEAHPIAELLERPSETLLSLTLIARAAARLGLSERRSAAESAIASGLWHDASEFALAQRQQVLSHEKRCRRFGKSPSPATSPPWGDRYEMHCC